MKEFKFTGKKTYTYELDLEAQKSVVKNPETGKVVFEMTLYNPNNLEHHRQQIEFQLGMMPGNRTNEIELIQVEMKEKKSDQKPTLRQFLDSDMNWYHPEYNETQDEDDIIEYIPNVKHRDLGFDDIYSDILDCVIDGFDPLTDYNANNVKEGFKLIKQGVAQMLQGSNLDK